MAANTMACKSSRPKLGDILVVVAWVCVSTAASFAQTSQGRQAGEVQNDPITEPRSAEHKPSGPPIPKGIQAITQTEGKCSTELIVNADALFKPTRWTLNSDAKQTLDALATLITKAGKHPVRITAFSGSDNSEKNNQIVAEKRALTVRTWLRNRGLIPDDTPITGIGKFGSGDKEPKEPIEVVIDTCKQLPGPKESS
ncbi:MAG: OmpA family protein [Candidatus Korobacteraceae bacterium]